MSLNSSNSNLSWEPSLDLSYPLQIIHLSTQFISVEYITIGQTVLGTKNIVVNWTAYIHGLDSSITDQGIHFLLLASTTNSSTPTLALKIHR